MVRHVGSQAGARAGPASAPACGLKCDRDLLEMGITTQLTPLQRRKHVTWAEMRTITAGAAGYRAITPSRTLGWRTVVCLEMGLTLNVKSGGPSTRSRVQAHHFPSV